MSQLTLDPSDITVSTVYIALRTSGYWTMFCERYVLERRNALLRVTYTVQEWGWNGLITSDWTGTYSTVGSIKAGLDLEMP